MAARSPDQISGLALVCPLSVGVRDEPAARVAVGSNELGDGGFRGYFGVRTPEILDRYKRYVAPAPRSATTPRSSGSVSGGS